MCESMEMSMIARQAAQAVTELLEQANLQPGQILVVGCSSSEIVGGHIGKNSSMQAAAAIYSAIAPIVKQKKLYLAAQCCEHLNRAIILEAEAAEKYGYDVLDNVLIAASALCKDYPEFEIYFDIEEVVDGDMTTALRALYFLPSDPNAGSADREKVKKEVQTFENDSDLIVAAMPRDFSTYDKYRYLAAVISLITNYDYTLVGGKSAATAYGAIELGMCICQGYSTGFEYLCRKADLWCAQVSGVSQGVSHAWNLVKLESGTYHVDVTWADADDNKLLDAGWQSYFMLTQDEILVDHEIDDETVATGI